MKNLIFLILLVFMFCGCVNESGNLNKKEINSKSNTELYEVDDLFLNKSKSSCSEGVCTDIGDPLIGN